MSSAEPEAASLCSMHIRVTKSSTDDCSKAVEEDIGQAGMLPGDTSVYNHSHSRRPQTGSVTTVDTWKT